jgi:hypothetical protein
MKEDGFEYQVRKSARRRTLSITVYPDNRVVVSAPANCSRKNILRFVESKTNWVLGVLQANVRKINKNLLRRFETGEELTFLGSKYILRVEDGTPPGVMLQEGHIRVRLPAPDFESNGSEVRKHLLDWYMTSAVAKIHERLPIYADKIGVKPGPVAVKSMKSRWGSCSIRGRISFAWNIIMAPEPVLDYLVVHELCHLLHHNHSLEYWKLVSTLVPDHKERRKWLRENGDYLRF